MLTYTKSTANKTRIFSTRFVSFNSDFWIFTGEDKEESKELLEKKEGQEEGQEATEEASEPKPSLLQNLRNVASQVFKSKKSEAEADKDVEAGEKDELLEGKEGVKEGKEGELEEVKVVEGEDKGEDGEDEKKDPEKPYSKYLNQACEARDICLQKYNGLERPKQLAVLGTAGSLLLLLFILIIVAIATPSQWTNYARISECGKYVTTHTNCGPIQGLVEAYDQFSFKRIPYAVPVQNTDRYAKLLKRRQKNSCKICSSFPLSFLGKIVQTCFTLLFFTTILNKFVALA